MTVSLKTQIKNAQREATLARDTLRRDTIRLIQADIQRAEKDQRLELTDDMLLPLLAKMVKQRRDSAKQYQAANRPKLAEQELREIDIINEFLPKQLEEADYLELIEGAILAVGATEIRDLGKVMKELKPKIQGRADMGQVSQLAREKLSQG